MNVWQFGMHVQLLNMLTKWWQEMCSVAKHTFYSVRLVEVHNTMHINRRHCITSLGLILQKTNDIVQQHGLRSDFLAEITNLSMRN